MIYQEGYVYHMKDGYFENLTVGKPHFLTNLLPMNWEKKGLYALCYILNNRDFL